ncbi:MAG: hypothetical protein ACTSVA_02040 [Candidatus Njordarchaeales archaeon]
MKEMKEPDLISIIWSYLRKQKNGVSLTEIYEMVEELGFSSREASLALETLHRLYLIEYDNDYQGKVVVKKRSIFNNALESFPCLSCEHLYECYVGGSLYAPEKCPYLDYWFRQFRYHKVKIPMIKG